MSSRAQRVDAQPAYLLHAYPYRETSLVAELFSRDHGRVALVARGAKRPRSALRGTLVEFQELELDWFGQGELKTLAHAEWRRARPMLRGRALLLGYYLNELVLRLMARDDPHPGLFASYETALRGLSEADLDESGVLRGFELSLLRELGYGLSLDTDAESGQALEAQARYRFVMEQGLVREALPGDGVSLSGAQAQAIVNGDFSDPLTARLAKQLMRMALNHYLHGQELRTRRVFIELQDF